MANCIARLKLRTGTTWQENAGSLLAETFLTGTCSIKSHGNVT